MTTESLTQHYLKTRYIYNPDTGGFHSISKGRLVGHIKKSSCKKYKSLRIKDKYYQLHRLIWIYVYGRLPKDQIDHINGNGLDNRICNLRDVTQQPNQRNRKLNTNNKSGVTGLSCRCGNYCVEISVNGKNSKIGTFKDRFDAICARKSAEYKLDYHPNCGRNRDI